ncbi:D-alanyl-D-alanine dipeptidase [Modestobacter sp. DSM 44400]|uniref:M15 family metallopeptidase n=1 Tax=Modestobacter sp. DSM 44400 TaxID=1550230 RepID=UPI0008943B10|nr:M15 family metallopeptidase [Modestobacter sp. DSM 44400]SDY90603.1 D-alanyl-D-alanine dipeptidase [Modestobacter sp. DSM 44400]
MSDLLLMADPRVASMPVRDCRGPLVDLHTITSLRLDDRKRDPRGHFARLRRGVAGRLEEATTLLPEGLSLLVIEAYRSPELQQRYFTGYRAKLAATHPGWTDPQLDTAASRYVSPPAVAPHCAGAAVDLTLCTSDGQELDMGTRVDATPEDSGGGCYTEAANISGTARGNRSILIRAPQAVGLVNYPTEWWHWSFGDRYWATVTGAPAACYGRPSRNTGRRNQSEIDDGSAWARPP